MRPIPSLLAAAAIVAALGLPGTAWSQSSRFGANGPLGATTGTAGSGGRFGNSVMNGTSFGQNQAGGLAGRGYGSSALGGTGLGTGMQSGFGAGLGGTGTGIGNAGTGGANGFVGRNFQSQQFVGQAGATNQQGVGQAGGLNGRTNGGNRGNAGLNRQILQQLNGGGGFGGMGGNGGVGAQSAPPIRPQQRIAFDYPAPQGTRIESSTRVRFGKFAARNPSLAGINMTATDDGVVTLQGQVTKSDDVRLAEQLIRLEPGVRSVNNQLTVANVTPATAPLTPTP